MEYSNSGCMPAQDVTLSLAINDLSDISVLDCNSTPYTNSCLKVSWSYDGTTWSCFADYSDAEKVLVDSSSDFYVKYRVSGVVSGVKDGDDNDIDYTTSIASGLQLPTCNSSTSSLQYNPYAGLTSAIALQQALSDSVSCLVGIPIYYIKLKPESNSKDLAFKEYTLMNVDSIKQIKLIINDGTMPSSKPEFSDFGLDWQTDWETEISKSMFATAFGSTAQPMEGDLIYIPMMKRMWMVNESYEEKNGSLMWINTTFKVMLVKYQEKGSVDLGDMASTVDALVKNQYEDLFGDQETVDSGAESVETPQVGRDVGYPVYMSDATRKYLTSQSIDLIEYKTYTKATVVSSNAYKFNYDLLSSIGAKICYQRKYCGTSGAASFIIGVDTRKEYSSHILSIGHITVDIKLDGRKMVVSCPNTDSLEYTVLLKNGNLSENAFFIWLRWSKELNITELGVCPYTYNENLPLYKLQPIHYKYDLDNPAYHKVVKWNTEMMEEEKSDIYASGFPGLLTNVKVYDVYVDNLSLLLQQYPTHQHLIVNDTARPIVDVKSNYNM